MKVLWFSNRYISEEKITGTGTWLVTMAEQLVQNEEIQLYNITRDNVSTIEKSIYKGLTQWRVPIVTRKKNGLPPSKMVTQIQSIVQDIKPDIIHIWGTEGYWGLLFSRGIIKGVVLLEIQGLLTQIHKHTFADLTFKDIVKCFGFKEIIKPSVSLLAKHKVFKTAAKFELEIIKNSRYISTQSNWVRAHISFLNPDAIIFQTKRPIRRKFYEDSKWDIQNIKRHSIFTSASSPIPYKGLHVLIEAVALLKCNFSNIKLYVAGHIGKGIRESGYIKFIKKKINKLDLCDNVIWLGPLNEVELVNLQTSLHTSVYPSFIESYGVAVAESLSLGVPTVVSYSGALPEQGIEGDSIQFFPPGDVYMCAYKIRQIFENDVLAEALSTKARLLRKEITNNDISNLQINIYKKILFNDSDIIC